MCGNLKGEKGDVHANFGSSITRYIWFVLMFSNLHKLISFKNYSKCLNNSIIHFLLRNCRMEGKRWSKTV